MDPSPVSRRLPEIPQEVSSTPSSRQSGPVKGWSSTIEVKMSTLAVYSLGFVVLLCLAFVGGRSSVPDLPPGSVSAASDTSLSDGHWQHQLPVLNPEPVKEEALRDVRDSQNQPIDLSAVAPEKDPVVTDDPGAISPVVDVDQVRWAVMVGQKLSAEVEIVDQLLAYVDSGLTDAVSRIRVREYRSGQKRYDVYVGPFLTKGEAQKALIQLMELRSTLGIRFGDSYITRMTFTSEELEALELMTPDR